MLLRLLAIRGGSKPVDLVHNEPITVQASPAEDGTPREESAFFEADTETGAALVTWMGAEGCSRIYRKGNAAPELLQAGEQVQLGVSDKIDLAACSLEEANSQPQSKSTFMLTKQLARAPTSGADAAVSISVVRASSKADGR